MSVALAAMGLAHIVLSFWRAIATIVDPPPSRLMRALWGVGDSPSGVVACSLVLGRPRPQGRQCAWAHAHVQTLGRALGPQLRLRLRVGWGGDLRGTSLVIALARRFFGAEVCMCVSACLCLLVAGAPAMQPCRGSASAMHTRCVAFVAKRVPPGALDINQFIVVGMIWELQVDPLPRVPQWRCSNFIGFVVSPWVASFAVAPMLAGA